MGPNNAEIFEKNFLSENMFNYQKDKQGLTIVLKEMQVLKVLQFAHCKAKTSKNSAEIFRKGECQYMYSNTKNTSKGLSLLNS